MFLNIFWSTGITHKQLFHWLIKSIQAIPFFLFSIAGNGFPDIGSVSRIEKKNPKKSHQEVSE